MPKPKLTILVTPTECGHCKEHLPEFLALIGKLQREGEVDAELVDLEKRDVPYEVKRVPAFHFDDGAGCTKLTDLGKLKGGGLEGSIRAWMGKQSKVCARPAKRASA